MRTPKHSRRAFLRPVFASFLGVHSLSGCGYSVRAPFDNATKTIYVPIFRSVTFRRDMGIMLTKKVIDEINKRTPFRVVGTQDEADTILDGTVNFADKNIIVESPFNLPRQLTATVNASVSWTHNPPTKADIERGHTVVADTVNFFPEIGESSYTAFDRCNTNLAKQIIDMMEQPW